MNEFMLELVFGLIWYLLTGFWCRKLVMNYGTKKEIPMDFIPSICFVLLWALVVPLIVPIMAGIDDAFKKVKEGVL